MTEKYKEPWTRIGINNYVLEKTYEYQKKYGFKIGTGEHATWNNEADAFKHAFLAAYMSLRWNEYSSKFIGDFHEMETPNAPKSERNMDLWNNSIGREIANEIREELGNSIKLFKDDKRPLYDKAAQKVIECLKNGELITSPDDKRSFDNMLIDRLGHKDRVFYKGELDNYTGADKDILLQQYMNQSINNNWKMPSKAELNAKAIMGDLIYVNNYTRQDGVKVHGYYRRRVIR